jgi:hypothetical protein
VEISREPVFCRHKAFGVLPLGSQVRVGRKERRFDFAAYRYLDDKPVLKPLLKVARITTARDFLANSIPLRFRRTASSLKDQAIVQTVGYFVQSVVRSKREDFAASNENTAGKRDKNQLDAHQPPLNLPRRESASHRVKVLPNLIGLPSVRELTFFWTRCGFFESNYEGLLERNEAAPMPWTLGGFGGRREIPV